MERGEEGYAGRYGRWKEGKVRDGGAGVGAGVEAELRRQLRDKDELLRQLERQQAAASPPPMNADMVVQVVGELQTLRDIVMQVIALQREAAGVPTAIDELGGRVEVLESLSNTHCVQLRGVEDRILQVEDVAPSPQALRGARRTPVPPAGDDAHGVVPAHLDALHTRLAEVEKSLAAGKAARGALHIAPPDMKAKGVLELAGRQDGFDARVLRLEEMVAEMQNEGAALQPLNESGAAGRRRVEDRMMDVELRVEGIERRLDRLEGERGGGVGGRDGPLLAGLEARLKVLEKAKGDVPGRRARVASPPSRELDGVADRLAALEAAAAAAPAQLSQVEQDVARRVAAVQDEHQSNVLALHDRVAALAEQHTKTALAAAADRRAVEHALAALGPHEKPPSPPPPLRTGSSSAGTSHRADPPPSSSAPAMHLASALEVLTQEWQRRERAAAAAAAAPPAAPAAADLKAKVGALLRALDAEEAPAPPRQSARPGGVRAAAALFPPSVSGTPDVSLCVRTKPYEYDETASLPTTIMLPSTPMYTPIGKASRSSSPCPADPDGVSSVAGSAAASVATTEPPPAPAPARLPAPAASTPTPERRQGRSTRFNVPQRRPAT